MLDFLLQLPAAWKRLRRAPGLALLCLLTLAVGVGATTAVFSLVDTVLLNPLPYPRAERLVGLWHTAPGLDLDRLPQSTATYLFYQERSRALADLALYRETQVNLTGGDVPERTQAAAVTASLFRTLAVEPRLGRAFLPEEEKPGAPPAVLLSDGIWRRRFGADPAIVGKKVRINGLETEVAGVMRADFDFPNPETELWLPLTIDAATAELGRFEAVGVGRLAPGASAASAQDEMNQLLRKLGEAFPGSEAAPVLANAGFAARIHPLREDVVGDVGGVLWILLAAVAFVLLIACANVANLLIVRGEGRRRETAIQLSLGAPRGRLVGAVLAESLTLGLGAGVLGLLLAAAGLRLLVAYQPVRLPRLDQVGIDGSVLAFTAAVAVLTGLLFGWIPALRSTASTDLLAELKGGGRAVTQGRAGRHSRRLLVGLQVALALILLSGSGLMLQSALRLARLDPGFSAPQVLTLQLVLAEADAAGDVAAARFFQTLVERLAALPGIEAVGAVSSLPLSGSAEASGIGIEDFPLDPAAPPPVVGTEYVTADYFKAMRIPLVAGRALERSDQEQRTGSVVVSEAFARRYWPRGSALGKRLRPGNAPETPWHTIVGVAGDVRNRRLTDPPGEIIYFPLPGRAAGDWTVRRMSLVLRTAGAPESLAAEVRREIRAYAPGVPVAAVEPLTQLVQRARARLTFTALMFAVASLIALILGGVGIYAFVSYMVGQRTPEIGVRMAVGAGPWTIRWMVLREVLVIAAAGIAVGLAGAFALTRWLGSVLFEVSPLDPLTFTAVPLLLVVLALAASYLPAERASQVDPLIALQRAE